MPVFDLALVVVVVMNLVLGVRQGFLLGVWGIATFALTAACAVFAAPRAAEPLVRVTGWPLGPVALAVAALVVVLGSALYGRLALPVATWLAGRPRLARVDHALGLLPGAAWGALAAVALAWFMAAFSGAPPSALAARVTALGERPLEAVIGWVPPSWPRIAVLPGGAWVTGAGPATDTPPTMLEREMLSRVNAARKQAGLLPLAWDGRLAEVGRAHSADMLKRGYFAHADPDGRTVAERAAARGVRYLLIGENLAFAPSLEIAHRGLMESPGHRANILRKGFGRAGIGIVRLPAGARYAPGRGQKPLPLGGTGGYLLVTQVFKN